MCWEKALNKNKAGDIVVNNIVLAKNLTDKEFVQFVEYNIKKAKAKYKDLPNDQALAKHLQDLAETIKLRRTALSKFLHKFDNTFFNHLDGEFNTKIIEQYIETINYNFKTEFLVSQGGHRGSAILEGLIEIISIKIPPNTKSLKHVLEDVPFKAKIKVKYKNGYYLEKETTTSMFPKNWSIERIQEEVALVYENTFANKKGLNPSSINKKFKQYKFKNSIDSFDILIEIDELGNIMNAYPLI